MYLLYKSEIVDIYFDEKQNLLVQRWNNKPYDAEAYTDVRKRSLLFYNSAEIEKVFNKNPSQIIEANLQTLLLNWEPGRMAQA